MDTMEYVVKMYYPLFFMSQGIHLNLQDFFHFLKKSVLIFNKYNST